MKTPTLSLVIWLGLLVVVCSADTIEFEGDSFSSTEGLGNFSAKILFTPDNVPNPNGGQLVIVLENTSDPDNGGFITGFVLNNPVGRVTNAMLTSSPASFSQLGLGHNSINAQPFGDFDLGAALGGDFQGGGDPHPGIRVGATEEFKFWLSGDLSGLTEQHFLDEQSEPRGNRSASFVVRFRGFNDGGSDKVPGTITPPDPQEDPQVVPEPSSLAIWSLLGLVALGLASRSRKPAVPDSSA